VERNENPTYEHDMDVKMENKDTQRYTRSYNYEYDETNTNKNLFSRTRVSMRLIRYTNDSKA
jgi:hypothetical protein